MFNICPELINQAKVIAEKMLISGSVIEPIPFGAQENAIFISTDEKLVVATKSLNAGGKIFLIGCKAQ